MRIVTFKATMAKIAMAWVWMLAIQASAQTPQPNLDGVDPPLAAQITEAQALIEDSREDGPAEHAAAWGELGMLYQALEYVDEALESYRQAQRIQPFDGRWPYLIGMVLAEQGQTDDALLNFTASIALMPSQASAAWIRSARVLLDAGRAEQALLAVERALERDDASASAMAAKGEALLALGQPEAAIEALEAALQIEPRANRLRFPLGMAYRALGDTAAMERELERAGQVGVSPDDPVGEYLERHARGSRIHALRARRAFRAGDHEAALGLFRRALEFDPDNAQLIANLGVTLAALGRIDEAIDSLQRSILLDPTQDSARINLAELLRVSGQPAAALEVMTDPSARFIRFEDLVLRARIAREAGEPELAANSYLEALDKDKDLQAWREAIEVLLALDRYSEVKALATHTGLNDDGLGRVAVLTHGLLELQADKPAAVALAADLSEFLFDRDDSLAYAALQARVLLVQEQDCRAAIQWLMSLERRADWSDEKVQGARRLALELARQPRCQTEP
jgi:tetratricopeptide (TPR) repeat protein